MPWVYSPHSGGKKIPEPVQERTRQRILAHAEKNYAGKFASLDVRFRGALCYIDAYTEPFVPPGYRPRKGEESRQEKIERLRRTPLHLCRLRYFGDEDRWTLAFFTYSNEKYSPCVFDSGDDHGTPEEGFDVGAVYLSDE